MNLSLRKNIFQGTKKITKACSSKSFAMLENQPDDVVEKISQSKVVFSIIIERSANTMHSLNKVHKIEHEPC